MEYQILVTYLYLKFGSCFEKVVLNFQIFSEVNKNTEISE